MEGTAEEKAGEKENFAMNKYIYFPKLCYNGCTLTIK